jgi:hypothetical protein
MVPKWVVILVSLWATVVALGSRAQESAGTTGEAGDSVHELDYTIALEVVLPACPKGEGVWFQPRPVAIPLPDAEKPPVVMTIQRAIGSDFFTGLAVTRTDDMGQSWAPPREIPEFGWRDAEEGLQVGVCDFTWAWHAPSGKAIGIGHTARYTKKGFAGYGHRRDSTYSVYDPKTDTWTPWTVLELPETDNDKYFFNGVHGQWLVEPDGTLLVPLYFVPRGQPFLAPGMVARFGFDGSNLTYIEHGLELTHNVPRGLYEKSLTIHGGRYYMTMRNDEQGFVAVSEDGLNFGPIKAWTFDDGSDLGSYNTQQKWVTHSEGLFLVYTRRGADNDHIIRHRAPLFIARVDTENLCVLRDTERIAVPERGRALGNFDATTINAHETWITVAGGEAFCARVRWSKPNKLAGRVN